MKIIFLGTSSCFPTPYRGVSCTALKFESGETWLFDCGEGSQIQLQRSSVKIGKVTKIFITHLHGDHLFGLPGLMCTLGNLACEEKKNFTLDVYGPHGLRKFIRSALELSRSELPFTYKVHELVILPVQYPDDWSDWEVQQDAVDILHPQEQEGNNVEANSDSIWELFRNNKVSICAGWLKHRIPSFGYVIVEKGRSGNLDVEGLKNAGLQPGPLYGKIQSGNNVTLEDGTVIHAADFVSEPHPDVKVVMLGDTQDDSAIDKIAVDANVIVHEATLENSLESRAKENGHSTPRMAANFSSRVNAKHLILTHFSNRYRKAEIEAEVKTNALSFLLEEAKAELLALSSTCTVSMAEDLLEFIVET